jgi:hypothetical protein
MTLAGHFPFTIAPLFFGGRLIALSKKKSDSIRPILIGMTLHRLASNCASQNSWYCLPAHVSSAWAFHAARRSLQAMIKDQTFVILDVAKAF